MSAHQKKKTAERKSFFVFSTSLFLFFFFFSLVLGISSAFACGGGKKKGGSGAPSAYMSPALFISAEEMKDIKVKVDGMDCEKCAKAIEAEVSKIKGVAEVHADWEKGECHVKMKKDVKLDDIFKAIKKAGFEPKGTI